MIDVDYDIIIIGGGLVGTSLALALKDTNLRIAIIEAKSAPDYPSIDNLSVRSIALSAASHDIFNRLGIWPLLQAYTTPIKTTEISDRGHFGTTIVHAREFELEALGYSIPLLRIAQTLEQSLTAYPQVAYLRLAHTEAVDLIQHSVTLIQQGERQILKAALIVAADGINSAIRDSLDIQVEQVDHQQVSLASNVQLAGSHQYRAYERFTEQGPIALLPMDHQHMALVWAVHPDQAEQLSTLCQADALARLQYAFGYRAGKFIAMNPLYHYPVPTLFSKEQIKPGFVLLGNAAHTLHPVAAQGFNLSLRDVEQLARVIQTAVQRDQDIGDIDVLKSYVVQRRSDQQQTWRFTQDLLHIFSHNHFPFTPLRNIGLGALNYFPSIKRELAKRAMGFRVSP